MFYETLFSTLRVRPVLLSLLRAPLLAWRFGNNGSLKLPGMR
jgi:hypothetical protein